MKKRVVPLLMVICLLLVLLPTTVLATDAILYVAPSAGGAADGSSWDNPTTIDAAWTAATSGTKIFVKTGTYTRTAALTLKNGVSIYGGFAGTEASEDERATSDLDLNGIVEPWEFTNASALTGAVRFFAGANVTAVVDGFTMTSTSSTGSGAVIQLYSGNVLQNSIVTGSNSATRGVIFIEGGKLLSSYIHDNKGNTDRGCISVYYGSGNPTTIADCRIENNKAQYGGAIYSRAGSSTQVNVINNLIIGNEATQSGGGLYFGSGSNPPTNAWVINNTIVNNTVENAPLRTPKEAPVTALEFSPKAVSTPTTTSYRAIPAAWAQAANRLPTRIKAVISTLNTTR